MIASLPINQLTFALSSNTSLTVRYILSTAPTGTSAYVRSTMGSTIGTTPTSSTPERPALVGEIDKNLKYKSIEAFNGERNQLHEFLLQLRLYIKFNGDRFRSETEQVLWAVTLLEGKALNWIEGFLEDYLVWSNKNKVINK